jgi:hypothetical protein
LPFLPVTGTRAAARASLSALDYSLGSTLYLGAALGGIGSNQSQEFANNVREAVLQRAFRQRDLPSDVPYITTRENKETPDLYLGKLKTAYDYRNAMLVVMNRSAAYVPGAFLLPLAMKAYNSDQSEYVNFWTPERGLSFIVGGLGLLHLVAFANQGFVTNGQRSVTQSNSYPGASSNSSGALSNFALPFIMMVGFTLWVQSITNGGLGWTTTVGGMPAPFNSSAAG